jgi:Protein of unknown function (DUF664)
VIPFAQAVETFLASLSGQALAQLEGLPEDDLNEWKPRQELEDINTFAGLATHLVGSGEYWVLEAVGGRALHRDRPAEFRARGDLATLKARYEQWLNDSGAVLASLTEEDLSRIFERAEDKRSGLRAVRWTFAECLVHAVEHTAVHVGHLQIQRQLWDAERGSE